MVANLQRIHKPETLDAAAELLKQPNVYPLYSGGTSLVLPDSAQEGVELTGLVSDTFRIEKSALWIGGRTLLGSLAASDSQMGDVLQADVTSDLLNTLSVGDVLLASHPDSLTLALMVGFKAQLYCHAAEPFDIENWFDLSADERRQRMVLSVAFPEYFNGSWRLVFEEVGPTPDAEPVVAAIGFARGGSRATSVMTFYFAVCGLADRPARYKARDVSTLKSLIDDQRGSAQYRTETAKVIANRVIMKAVMAAQQGNEE